MSLKMRTLYKFSEIKHPYKHKQYYLMLMPSHVDARNRCCSQSKTMLGMKSHLPTECSMDSFSARIVNNIETFLDWFGYGLMYCSFMSDGHL